MIGVAANSSQQDVVSEFFELFKTPWEFHRKDGRYDVLVCTRPQVPPNTAKLVLLYNAEAMEHDTESGVSAKSGRGGGMLVYEGRRIPIYGDLATFPGSRSAPVVEENTEQPAVFASGSDDKTVWRIGYNLFTEVRHLLQAGQPAANAGIATLELHIALLRDLMIQAGIPVVEIPPVPGGHSFIACLTHDIDHPVLRNHCGDHTMAGFLYRATVGTVAGVCRGRKSFRDLRRNWAAAVKLPFVYLGMARDFWCEFDRYVEMEAGLASTYFVIPTRDYAGRPLAGDGISKRAARYDIADIKPQLQKAISSGCEIGLHGIDTWADSAKGCEERDRVTQALGVTVTGVRMHWLFFDEKSPGALDGANFSYDSTVGYNETVGYRAGTTQVYRPLGAVNLLELPLHVMDTALFYPNHLDLSEADARQTVVKLVDDVAEFGGVLTINWHDRSIAPERLWDGFYLRLLEELKGRGAWFATAEQVVSWFRKRRSATVEAALVENDRIKIKASVQSNGRLPGFRVRIHRPGQRNDAERTSALSSSTFVDLDLHEEIDFEFSFSPSARGCGSKPDLQT